MLICRKKLKNNKKDAAKFSRTPLKIYFLFNRSGIAILKANEAVDPEDRATEKQIESIVDDIASRHRLRLLVEDIQDMVEEKLMELQKYQLMKAYMLYRYERALIRKANTTDESILLYF